MEDVSQDRVRSMIEYVSTRTSEDWNVDSEIESS